MKNGDDIKVLWFWDWSIWVIVGGDDALRKSPFLGVLNPNSIMAY